MAPENTMSAFREALRLGADGIELDVHASGDGGLVVIHDHDVSRTTDGAGDVRHLSTQELRGLDAGTWFSPMFQGERLPLLDEVLARPSPSFEIQLCGLTSDFVARVARTVEERVPWSAVEFTSLHALLLAELKRIRPEARLGLFAPARPTWMSEPLHLETVLAHAELLRAEVVHVAASALTTGLASGYARPDIVCTRQARTTRPR